MKPTVCRSCKAPVIWTITRAGKRAPLNAEPRENGNLVVRGIDTAQPISYSVSDPDPFVREALERGDPRYTNHFSDCPQSQQWRRR